MGERKNEGMTRKTNIEQNSILRLFKVFGSYLPTTALIQTDFFFLEYDTFY